MILQIKRIRKIQHISIFRSIFWFFAVFCYFFQVPYRQLATYIIPCLGIFLTLSVANEDIFETEKTWLKAFIAYIIYLTVLVAVSLMKEYPLLNIIRFYLILVALPIFAIAKYDHFEFEQKVFLILSVAKSIMLIYFAIRLLYTGTYWELRVWARTNGFGDIYLVKGIPKVQLHGNGILPLSYIVNHYINRDKKTVRIIYAAILLGGILSAGNTAFMLGIALFYGYQLLVVIRNRQISGAKRLIAILVLLLLLISFAFYSYNEWEAKAGYSNRVRFEQARVLLNNYLIIGKGLGSELTVTGVRNTQGSIYYELQTLYIFNQIGIFGLILFYFLVLRAVLSRGKTNLMIFLIYLVYTFWNPYCFDSTEMIALCIINSIIPFNQSKM